MNVRQIKQRAVAVEKTKKIVKAMQVVALTRLKKYEAAALHGKTYFETMHKMMAYISQDLANRHPLLKDKKDEKVVWVLVIGSDKGLCGNFNTNMFKGLGAFIEEKKDKEVNIIPVGKKMVRYVMRRYADKVKLKLDKIDDDKQLNEFLDSLQDMLAAEYEAGRVDAFYILYSEFKGHVLGKAGMLSVLPIRNIASNGNASDLKANFIFEPDEDDVLAAVVKEYISSQVNQAVLESRAAEELSRMMAMKSATENADKLLHGLMLTYHKARQASITGEIIEIINAQGV